MSRNPEPPAPPRGDVDDLIYQDGWLASDR